MRRSVLVLLFVGALAAGCGDKDVGVLSVTPAAHDFGRVRHGSVRVAEFTIKNNGDQTLRLTAKPSCQCFRMLQGGQASLEPGESTVLRVRFDSGKLIAGPMRTKRVDIFTDDPAGAHARLDLRGDVYKPVKLDPSELRLGRLTGKVNEIKPKPFRIRPTEDGARLTASKITVIPTSFIAVEAIEVDGGVDLHVSLLPDQQRPQGDVFAAIDIRVNVLQEGKAPETVALRAGVRGYWVADTQGPPPGK